MTACLSPSGLNTYRSAGRVQRLLVATLKGVRVLERTESGWSVAEPRLDGEHVGSLIYDAAGGGVFAGVHRGGVYFSADQGRTWERRDRGIAVPHIYAMGLGAIAGKPVIYAGTEPPHLYRSLDYGLSWQELPALQDVPGKDKWMFPDPTSGPHVKFIISDPRDGNTIFVGVEQGALLKSVDGGQSFRELESYYKAGDPVFKDAHQLIMRPSNPDRVYLTTGQGLYRSFDGGENFQRLTDSSFRIGYPDQIQFAPNADQTLFMAGSAKTPYFWYKEHTANSLVFRSDDAGEHWRPASAGLPDPMRSNIEAMTMVGWQGGFSLFAGNTAGEIYESEDGGESWTLIARDLSPISKDVHYVPLEGKLG